MQSKKYVTDVQYETGTNNEGLYTGNLINGKRNGKGKYIWTSEKYKGDVYEGDWKDDKKHG